jgi:hypothetical protein
MSFASLSSLTVLILFIAGCCAESPPPLMSSIVPKDLEISYSYGACHAEWGRTNIWINATGYGLYESGSGNLIMVEGEYRFEHEELRKRFVLNETELLDIVAGLEESGFYALNESYYDPEIMDGSCEGISITSNNFTKSVGVTNIAPPEAYYRAAKLIEGMAMNKTLT